METGVMLSPENLQWNIMADKVRNNTGQHKKDAKKGQKSIEMKQEAFLEALSKTYGIVTSASRATGIARSVHYHWLQEYPEYKQKVDELKNIGLDFAENKLLTQIEQGNTTAIIFYLKTQGKSRGYVERVEQDITNLDRVQVKINAPFTPEEDE